MRAFRIKIPEMDIDIYTSDLMQIVLILNEIDDDKEVFLSTKRMTVIEYNQLIESRVNEIIDGENQNQTRN